MHSRAARLVLLFLFLIAVSTASYLFWKGESLASAQAADARAFDESARTIERTLLDTRAAQRAYLATSQNGEFWASKVTQNVQAIREATTELRSSATVAQAQSGLDEVRSAIDDFLKVDKRAVEYVKREQRSLAADVIFADGVELTDAALTALAQARNAELSARAEVMALTGRRSVFAIAAGAASAVLVVLLLVPAPRARIIAAPADAAASAPIKPAESPRFVAPAPGVQRADAPSEDELWTPARRAASETAAQAIAADPAVADLDAIAPERTIEATAAAEPTDLVEPLMERPSQVEDLTDFAGVASLCIDLARVVDTRALPSLLDRAASLLDASGIILWIADPDGRELNPIFAQGYPQQLVNRLGTIPREAENATAAAFRTSLLQTVMADDISAGAIAAPLVTSGGCVGVMAAEVRNDAERQDLKLAAASIMAAQLATLVGPPAARNHARTGAAG
jgi:CHASE3 domain sensor protein